MAKNKIIKAGSSASYLKETGVRARLRAAPNSRTVVLRAKSLFGIMPSFRRIVWAYYKKSGRHDLPWRPPQLPLRRDKTLDLYRVLVSEIMLQQTQVDRVVPLYKKFIKQFPTARKLADAPLAEVLKAWQGLGYNRRAKMLHQAAKELTSLGKLNFPKLVAELERLPGVGPYTARAVAAFAYNQDVIVIETNIRTAVIQHFFPKKKKVSDAEIEKVLTLALPKGKSPRRQGSAGQAREWYSALMDYGAYLKRSGISHNAKSKGYAKQSSFKGSLREVRGAVLRALATRIGRSGLPMRGLIVAVEREIGADRGGQIREALEALLTEGLIRREKGRYGLGSHPIG